jgi:hypothetical protein
MDFLILLEAHIDFANLHFWPKTFSGEFSFSNFGQNNRYKLILELGTMLLDFKAF